MRINKINSGIIFKKDENKQVVKLPELKPVPEDKFEKEKKDATRNIYKDSQVDKSATPKSESSKNNNSHIRGK